MSDETLTFQPTRPVEKREGSMLARSLRFTLLSLAILLVAGCFWIPTQEFSSVSHLSYVFFTISGGG